MEDTPFKMTPDWSRDLAIACQSPIWRSARGIDLKARFVEAAVQYPTYDDMPANLKAVYDRAMAALHAR